MLRIPFFMQDGWPLCDFQEYIYDPKSHWYYTEEQVKEFESGKEKLPCERAPRPRCKCGILARRGVVPRSWATVGIVATLSDSIG